MAPLIRLVSSAEFVKKNVSVLYSYKDIFDIFPDTYEISHVKRKNKINKTLVLQNSSPKLVP